MPGYQDGHAQQEDHHSAHWSTAFSSSSEIDRESLRDNDSLFSVSDIESEGEYEDYEAYIETADDEFFIDEEGRFFDSDGYYVDEDGRYVDENGYFIDEYGDYVDEEGFYLSEEALHLGNIKDVGASYSKYYADLAYPEHRLDGELSRDIKQEALRRSTKEVINETNREVKMKDSKKLPTKLKREIKKEGKLSAKRHDAQDLSKAPKLESELQKDIKKIGKEGELSLKEQSYKSVRAQFIHLKDTIDGLTGAYETRKKTDFQQTDRVSRYVLWKSEAPNPARVQEIEAVQKVAAQYQLGKELSKGSTDETFNTETQRLSEAVSSMKDAATGLLQKVEAEYVARSATNSSLYSVLKESLTNIPKMSDIKEAEEGMSYTLTF